MFVLDFYHYHSLIHKMNRNQVRKGLWRQEVECRRRLFSVPYLRMICELEVE